MADDGLAVVELSSELDLERARLVLLFSLLLLLFSLLLLLFSLLLLLLFSLLLLLALSLFLLLALSLFLLLALSLLLLLALSLLLLLALLLLLLGRLFALAVLVDPLLQALEGAVRLVLRLRLPVVPVEQLDRRKALHLMVLADFALLVAVHLRDPHIVPVLEVVVRELVPDLVHLLTVPTPGENGKGVT